MTIHHDILQGGDDWRRARLGIATASSFDKIVTPKTAELSKQASGYANTLLAELITGKDVEAFPKTYWMERGEKMECEARAMYQAITDMEVFSGGFFTNDEMTLGASPDGRVVKDGVVVGGVEIKCPAPQTHIENLLRDKIDPTYNAQVQGQMLIGGLEFVDWFSYHPDMPPAHIRTYADPKYQDALRDALNSFLDLLGDRIIRLKARGIIVPPRPILAMHDAAQKKPTDMMIGG